LSKIEVDAIDKQSGSTLTLGGSGTAVTLACGATQTGFGRNGSVNWQTSIKTGDFTAANGEGYFIDTSSGTITMTLPSSPSVGDIVALKDYAGTFNSQALTLGRNGSNLDGNAGDRALDTKNLSMTLVYADSTKGWKSVEEGTGFIGESFMVATGGTITTSGNDKIHTFTGPGTFAVCGVASSAANNLVSYMVVAGGASGMGRGTTEGYASGGGGAGGYREVVSPSAPYTGSPTQGYATPGNRITVTATSYPITVGGGGATKCGVANPSGVGQGNAGSASVFSTITSAGGGGGGVGSNPGSVPQMAGASGGSGGGGGGGAVPGSCGGAGNTPPTTPAQGSNGGTGSSGANTAAGGGGGATAVGGNSQNQPSPMIAQGGNGGAGATTEITGSPVAYAGGGGGGAGYPGANGSGNSSGGAGGGGVGPASGSGTAGTANTGGGGGGAGGTSPTSSGGAGGSGIIIIRYKFQ